MEFYFTVFLTLSSTVFFYYLILNKKVSIKFFFRNLLNVEDRTGKDGESNVRDIFPTVIHFDTKLYVFLGVCILWCL